MEQIAANLTYEAPQNTSDANASNSLDVHLIKNTSDQTHAVFYRNQLISHYQKGDNYSRNMVVVQLFICHRVPQKTLSQVFQLTVQHISTLVNKYRHSGSAGIQDRTVVRIGNNQKIKGKVADEIIRQLNVSKENRPTYVAVVKHIQRKYGVQLSPHRISDWWRAGQESQTQNELEQPALSVDNIASSHNAEKPSVNDIEKEINLEESDHAEEPSSVEEKWQPNHVAGSFILYAMLNESQFLKPFTDNLKKSVVSCRKTVERVMLTLFFMHALRLKSIEQTKHLLAAHFGPLVLGAFCRLQSLR